MAPQLWFCCHPFKVVIKVLAVMVVSLIVLQYTVFEVVPLRGLFEARRLESLFAINSTLPHRQRPHIQHFIGHTMPPQTEQPDNITTVTLKTVTLKTVTVNSTSQALTTSPIPVSGRPLCPLIPPDLQGPVKVRKDPPPLEELEKLFPMLELGGRYRPTHCQARDRVAVVIPYRDRVQHLSAFLLNLHPMLQRQQLDYGIFVVEQEGNGQFNRAMLMNVGFVEALKLYNFDCFVFHDVDLLPEDDRNLYTCPEQPRHMSVAVDVFKYRLPYADIFGGVSAMTRSQFQKVNGFSNSFWGWGGEDDDMSNRIKHHNYHISRYPANIARYKMLAHRKQHANPRRYDWLNTGHKRYKTDGLNSLHYEVKELQLLRLYTRIFVKLATPS